MLLTRRLVAIGTLHLGGTVAHKLAHNYNYKLYNVRMVLFVLTGIDHGEYTHYVDYVHMCNNLVVIIKITIVVCIAGFLRSYDHNYDQNYV